MTSANGDYPYALHVALDGNGLNGLEGRAGICNFGYDTRTGRYAYKIDYFDGVAGGHAVSVDPSQKVGFLGNTGQHLLFYDAVSLQEAERISTLRFESTDASIKSSTHAVWLDDSNGITTGGGCPRYRIGLTLPARPG